MDKISIITDPTYKSWLRNLSDKIQRSQIKAAMHVNSEMLHLYWDLGHEIVEKQFSAKWGEGFLQTLSRDLLSEFPTMKGFSYKNLRSIRQWYVFYGETKENWKQVVSNFGENFFRVPWGHHLYIINRCKTISKALFYLNKVLEQNWSRSVLLNFLDSDLYEREGKAITNFKDSLPSPNSDLAQEVTRDPYCFDFTGMREPYDERQLKKALIKNIERFLLELGAGFAYMGSEYRLLVGDREMYMDMLFYNVNLRCYIVTEVKTIPFEPAHLGQLGTYMVAVDHQLKKEDDNKTLGLLICKTKDEITVRYALESSSQPISVSEYQLAKYYPKEVKGTLPSIEEIEDMLIQQQ